MAKGTMTPRPTHPGEILKLDVLPALGLSVAEAADDLGVSRQTLHRVIAGTASVTPEMAVRLGKFCGNGPDLWINLQARHDVWQAQRKLRSTLRKIRTRHAVAAA
jgi:addiction module HigA family antidote